MSKYHINLFFSDDDDCWVADVPDLRFCSALGETAEQAVREIQRAVTAWLKAAKESGKAIPKPKYRPAIYQIAQ
jgi:predicted RNase H-like HicB family nuclease